MRRGKVLGVFWTRQADSVSFGGWSWHVTLSRRPASLTFRSTVRTVGALFGIEGGGACLVLGTSHGSVRFGWGYDDDLPLSVVPRAASTTTPDGHPDWCAAWCGFYVGRTLNAGVGDD